MKKLAMCLAAMMAVTGVMAAENVIKSFSFASKKDISAWGSPKTYLKYDMTYADGVATLSIKEAIAEPKSAMQVMPFYNQGFKKGMSYKITGTLKSNAEAQVRFCIQLSGAPYSAFPFAPGKGKWWTIKLQPNEAKDFTIDFQPQEDITALCRVPGIHITAKSGTVVEFSNFKVIEVQP